MVLDWIEVCGIWRPNQNLELVIFSSIPFLNQFCRVDRLVILLMEATAIRNLFVCLIYICSPSAGGTTHNHCTKT